MFLQQLPGRGLSFATGALLLASIGSADVIDFEGLPAGTIVSTLNSAGGAGPILVNGFNPSLGNVNAAVIFDSANPTGGDADLGTPHSDFGGPGAGSAGSQGATYENNTALGMILIVDEHLNVGGNGLVTDPDDATVLGQTVEFDFSALGTITARTLSYIDIETERPQGVVELFDVGDNLLNSFALAVVGDNGVNSVSLGDTTGVDHARVTLNGSGALTGFEFDVDCTASLGDFVWNDLDGDGLQLAGEPGVAGVTVILQDSQGGFIGSTQTDSNGFYEFTGLCAGDYLVVVDAQSLPSGFSLSPCDQGVDDTLDSDCSPVAVNLSHGERDDSIDFGLTPEPFVNCVSLPNSTGQTSGVSGSGSTSIGDNQFVLTFDNLPPHQPAYLFYGTNEANIPFGSGIQCIGAPLVRYHKIPDIDANGTVVFPVDFTDDPLTAGFGEVVPGVPFYFQLWFRDPGQSPAFNMTDSLCVTFAP